MTSQPKHTDKKHDKVLDHDEAQAAIESIAGEEDPGSALEEFLKDLKDDEDVKKKAK
ncbi:hypothetical protein [Catenovulum adriaticum]|uniref:Prokaryotic ubiquitin-like protein Pup n=1 Tax=Catenovulum adriaticum TaxID=2984846 RepID=A0ABY7ATH7_9ALTE|nr:hypothetical protein [Catenovulum sp. TS8]WAJ71674.1 hypothetical protein OLW01_15140 [Catenovulum sp. TS8]